MDKPIICAYCKEPVTVDQDLSGFNSLHDGYVMTHRINCKEKMMEKTYCIPGNQSNASNAKATAKKIEKILDASANFGLGQLDGKIVDDLWNFRILLVKKLEAEGWTITVPDNKYKVVPPESLLSV